MTVKRSAFARDLEGSTGDFYNNETILYDAGIVDTCHYTLVKTYRTYSSKREAKCKLWTLVNNNVLL